MAIVELAFSRSEFATRLEAVRSRMQERGIDALIIDGVEALGWVTGYTVGTTLWRAAVIPAHGEPFLLVRSLDVLPARERSWISDLLGFRDWEDPIQILAAEMSKRGLLSGTVGIEYDSDSMPLSRFRQLEGALGRTPIDIGSALWALRWTKSEAEVAYFRRCAEICDAGILASVDVIREGGLQRDVLRAVADTYYKLGGDQGWVGPLTSGADWDSLHGHEHHHQLKRGEVVHIELCPKVSDYSARIMRSCVVGQASQAQEQAARILIAAQDEQLDAMKPGAVAHDIDAIVREAILRSGLRPTYDNITGYTLGAYPSSTQRVSDFTRMFTPTANWILEPGMVQHMYASAAGLAISETVLVTETGIERLTRSERKLFVSEA